MCSATIKDNTTVTVIVVAQLISSTVMVQFIYIDVLMWDLNTNLNGRRWAIVWLLIETHVTVFAEEQNISSLSTKYTWPSLDKQTRQSAVTITSYQFKQNWINSPN